MLRDKPTASTDRMDPDETRHAAADPSCSPWVWLLSACAAVEAAGVPDGTQDLPDCPPQAAIDDPEINALPAARTWVREAELGQDLIELGKNAEIPVQPTRTKFLGLTLRRRSRHSRSSCG